MATKLQIPANMTIPVGTGPSMAHAGSLRLNTTTKQLEIYTGNHWIPSAGVYEPQTWREWLDYFAGQFIDHGGIDHKLMYIQNKMHERFPGAYTVKHLGNGNFGLEFDTPANETWWRLKYD